MVWEDVEYCWMRPNHATSVLRRCGTRPYGAIAAVSCNIRIEAPISQGKVLLFAARQSSAAAVEFVLKCSRGRPDLGQVSIRV